MKDEPFQRFFRLLVFWFSAHGLSFRAVVIRSPLITVRHLASYFLALSHYLKPLKRFRNLSIPLNTRLKPGENERKH